MKGSVLILFASQTGTAEDLAKDTDFHLREAGLQTHCMDVYDCDIQILTEHPVCLLFASTWGEGEPPDDAEDFYNALETNTELNLSSLQFAVFGLGDSGYEQFNECGKNFDRMLSERGAHRILPRVDCDIDIDEPFEKWIEQIKHMFQVHLSKQMIF